MGNTHRVVLGVVCSLLLAHGAASAQGAPPPPPLPGGGSGPAAATGPLPTRWIGVGLVLVPVGTLSFEGGGMSDSVSMDPAYGLEVAATRSFGGGLSLVVAPRVLANIKGEDGTESATQFDLRLGFSFGKPMPPSLYLFGYGLAGYSIIALPEESTGESYSPSGLAIAFGGGAGYLLGPRLMATATLGYQIGFQQESVMGQSFSFKDDLLDLTFGIMTGLD